MLSRQEEEAERRATLENDRKVLEQQGSTFFQHGQSQAADESGGRYGIARPAPTVVSSHPMVSYPQLPESSPWSGTQPQPGDEPPLGFDNPALDANPAGVYPVSSPAAPGGAEAPSALSPLSSDVEHAAPPSSQQEHRDA